MNFHVQTREWSRSRRRSDERPPDRRCGARSTSGRGKAPFSSFAEFEAAENVEDQLRPELALNRQIDRPFVFRHRVGTEQEIPGLPVAAPNVARRAPHPGE